MIKFSIIMITLIAVFIASSTTFTVAHVQTEIQQRHDPNNSPHGLILISIGTAFAAIHLLIPSTSIQVIGSGTIISSLNGSAINGLIGQ